MARSGQYLHGVFLAFQFPDDQVESAAADVIPQVAALLQARSAGFRERAALVQLQLVARPVECHHFVKRRRVCAALPRHICIHQSSIYCVFSL